MRAERPAVVALGSAVGEEAAEDELLLREAVPARIVHRLPHRRDDHTQRGGAGKCARQRGVENREPPRRGDGATLPKR
eukprot:5943925-Prymnesium_polylepis.2